jgi:hypothetical protein
MKKSIGRDLRLRHRGVIGLLGLIAWMPPPDCRAGDVPAKVSTRLVPLGESEIEVATTERGGARFVFVNLHDDENTSVEAGLEALEQSGGRLVELRHGGPRNVAFKLRGEEFRVDPNRIFTPEGVRATLGRQSRYDEEAARAVGEFAEGLLAIYRLDQADAAIALHNNTEGNYSALSYAAGGDLARDAEAVFVREGSDPDDFFFVTERPIFDALKGRGDNVVLQDNRNVADDGSLAVRCGRASLRYINVEAEHGHREEQARMIRDLVEVLGELGPPKPR